jgi:hypothetical protein
MCSANRMTKVHVSISKHSLRIRFRFCSFRVLFLLPPKTTRASSMGANPPRSATSTSTSTSTPTPTPTLPPHTTESLLSLVVMIERSLGVLSRGSPEHTTVVWTTRPRRSSPTHGPFSISGSSAFSSSARWRRRRRRQRRCASHNVCPVLLWHDDELLRRLPLEMLAASIAHLQKNIVAREWWWWRRQWRCQMHAQGNVMRSGDSSGGMHSSSELLCSKF